MSLVVLSSFRDVAKSAKLADLVTHHGGVLGAAVCCSDVGGFPEDDVTTCASDRDVLLGRMFALAQARGLDVDLHVDENGNKEA